MAHRVVYYRNRKFIGKVGYQPKGVNNCVLQIMRLVIEDGCMIFIPQGGYERGGLKYTDPDIASSPLGKTFWVTGYRSHATRFNFSFQGYEQVFEKRNGNDKALDTPAITEPALAHRTINVIRDGIVVLPKFYAMLSETAWHKLYAGGVLRNSKSYYESAHAYLIDMTGKRIVPLTWSNPHTLGFVNLLKQKADLKAQECFLQAMLKNTPQQAKFFSGSPDYMHASRGRVHSGSAHRDYSKQVKDREVFCSVISIPSYVAPAYNFEELAVSEAQEKLKKVKERLNAVQFIIRVIEFAMWLNGDKAISWTGPAMLMKRSGEKCTVQQAQFQCETLVCNRWVEKVSYS